MNRRTFLTQGCACGLCSCGVVGALAPTRSPAAETETREDWRFPFIRKRYAKLLELLDEKVDDTTFNEILRQLGFYCASTYSLLGQHKGDVDGFISEFKQRANEDITYDRERGVIRIVGPERSDCFCPLLSRSVASGKACACSLGWQQYAYETLLGKHVEVELKESVLRGGSRCVFEVRVSRQLGEGNAEKPDAGSDRGESSLDR